MAKPAARLWSQDESYKHTAHAPRYSFIPAIIWRGYTFPRPEPTPTGKAGAESELLPDSPNHPDWPQPDHCILRPARAIRQPDRVSVYSVLTICRYMPDDASFHRPTRAIALLKPPPLKDKIANSEFTRTLHCATIFAMVMQALPPTPRGNIIMRIIIITYAIYRRRVWLKLSWFWHVTVKVNGTKENRFTAGMMSICLKRRKRSKSSG